MIEYTANRSDNKIEHLKQREQALKRRIAEIMGKEEASESLLTKFIKAEDDWDKVRGEHQKERPLLDISFEVYTVV